jgi:hypothetical protein
VGIWLINADVLAGSRFRISALAETVATLVVLAERRAHRPGQLARPAQQRAAFRARMAHDPIGRAFLNGALLPTWLADFLCGPPDDDEHTFVDEMQRIRSAPPAALRADLAGGDPALEAPDLPSRIAAVLDWVWTEVVEPDWQRRRRAFEADIVARTQRLSTSGWASALGDMRPGMRWLGEGRLQINAHDYPPRDLADGQLLFIPSTSARGWVGWHHGTGTRWSIRAPGCLPRAGPRRRTRCAASSARHARHCSACWAAR